MNTYTNDSLLLKDIERVLDMVKEAEMNKDYILFNNHIGNEAYLDVNPKYYHYVNGLQVRTIVYILLLLIKNKDIYYSPIDKLYHIQNTDDTDN